MSIAKKCDRCGKMYDQYNVKDSEANPNGIRLLNIDGRQQCFAHKLIDLCPDCMKQLQNWLKDSDMIATLPDNDIYDKCKTCQSKVKYQDGYESWSPKNIFEESYKDCEGLTFGIALEMAKKGVKVKRAGWNGKDQHIELATDISYKTASGNIVNVNHDAIGNKAIAFVGTSGVQLGWLASQADMLADDWMIVE